MSPSDSSRSRRLPQAASNFSAKCSASSRVAQRGFRLAFTACALSSLASAVGCGGSKGPAPSRGGEEVACPDGSANPGVKIRTVNCSTVVQFDGDAFEATLEAKEFAKVGVKNVDQVLREVSEAANDAQIQFTQTCELYNSCALTSVEYRERLDEAQAHFRRIREKVSLLEAASGDPRVLRTTLAELYVESVPRETVASRTLAVELSVQARTSSGVGVVHEGDILHSGDQLVFGLKTSQAAHVYVFQRKQGGRLDVLFPQPEITRISNPLPAGQLVRIPPAGQVFTLDDQDLGQETVYVAASLQPLTDLESALQSKTDDGSPQTTAVESAVTSLFDEGNPECTDQTRGLELRDDPCGSLTRGLGVSSAEGADDFFSDDASVRARAFPGDDVVLRAFSFQHR